MSLRVVKDPSLGPLRDLLGVDHPRHEAESMLEHNEEESRI